MRKKKGHKFSSFLYFWKFRFCPDTSISTLKCFKWVLEVIYVRTVSPFYHLQYLTQNHINYLGPYSLHLHDCKLFSLVFFFFCFTTSQASLSQNDQTTLFLSTKTCLSMLTSCLSKPSLHSQVLNTSQISTTIFHLQTFRTFPSRSLLKTLKLALLKRLPSQLASRT